MNTWIALLRGINVGGRNRLAMDALKSDCVSIGLHDPQTYIQSGNIVFRSKLKRPETISKKITSQLQETRKIETSAIVLSFDELTNASRENPYANVENAEKSVHFFFLSSKSPSPDRERLESLQGNREQYEFRERVFYLHAPDGIGRSKLAAGVERCLGVPVSARNQRTVHRLLAMGAETNQD